MRFLLSFLLVSYFTLGFAQNLGAYGAVYPIAEEDMLDFIHDKVELLQNSGQLNKDMTAMQERVKAHILRPKPTLLPSAKERKTYFYKPIFTVPYDIYDTNGKLLYRSGTTVNALDEQTITAISPYSKIPPFNETLLFIDGDNTAQISFAENYKNTANNLKIILTNGDIGETSKKLGRIYFDQNGVLIHKLRITAVPAVVTRDNTQLKIQEIPVGQGS